MNDRELLELAAKAAVIEFHRWMGDLQNRYLLSPDYESGLAVTWNPLTDDGDALRLAVNLRLEIAVHETYTGVINGNLVRGHESHNGDPFAATRRAIVRAAAAIGEAMP